MFLCYLDESGTVDHGTTSHFVLLGVAVHAVQWRERDAEIAQLKARHRLRPEVEIHTAYLMRRYPEQERIAGFEGLSDAARRAAVLQARRGALAARRGRNQLRALQKDYGKTDAYVHLTHEERRAFVREVADAIAKWPVRVFAEAQSKADHVGDAQRIFSFAFEQVVTRFHYFLDYLGGDAMGLLVQDNNETAASHLTNLMRQYHFDGKTRWVQFRRIVETPLFVDSELTSMVQIADLCSYATRRFFENNETDLFDRIYRLFDRTSSGKLVGLRHFTAKRKCNCRVCVDHGR